MPKTVLRIAPWAGALLVAIALLPGSSPETGRMLSPFDVQETSNPNGDSPWTGQTVTVSGVVTALSPHGRFYYIADPAGGAWSGLKVVGSATARRLEERVSVQGVVRESFGETVLEESAASSHGSGAMPPVADIDAVDLAAAGEPWEGVLVRLDGVRVEGFTTRFGEFPFSDASGLGGEVDDEFFHPYIADFGDTFAWIRGVVSYGFGDFRLEPRSERDLHGWVSARGNDGRMIVSVFDQRGRPIPAKITLARSDGITLHLGPDDRAEGSDDVAYVWHDRQAVPVPSGTYSYVVSHGIEYGLAEGQVTVPAGGEAVVHASLRREVDTTGWISGDFHLHSAPSRDTPLPVPGRIESLVGEGVEWAISTDHDVVTDYAPVIAGLGMGEWIRSSVGEEITTHTFGHFNTWPLEPDALPVSWGGLSPAGLFAAARTDPGVEVVQVNHPVVPSWGNQYFQIYAVSPFTGEPEVPGFSFDFDALEIFNGRFVDDGLSNFETWMRMLNNGHRATATGNSDSHHLVFREAGYPRNYVASSTDAPRDVSEDELIAAVLGGRSYLTYGPVLDFRANGGSLGELVAAPGGTVSFRMRVQVASWLDVTEATIYANGKIVATFPLDSTAPGPFETALAWRDTPAVDTWYLLRVEGPGDLSPVRRGPEFFPLAITNPIWVDVDGNGGFDPPGNVADAVTVSELDEVDGNGAPVRQGDWVSVTGCAMTDTRFGSASIGQFYVDDGTGGVQVREAVGTITEVRRGDRVWVGGFVTQTLGETVLSETEVQQLGTDDSCPVPTIRTTGEIAAGAGVEPLEGRVVRVQAVNVVGGTWPVNGAEGAVVLNDGTGPVTLYIPGNVVVPAEASGLVDFAFDALVGQRDFAPPFFEGYRLVLRDGADLFAPRSGATGAFGGGIPEGFSFGAPRPNPFRGSLRVPLLGVARGGLVPRIEIVDVTGRRVRSLFPASARASEIVWDGRDESGQSVAAGVYYLRLRGERAAETVRVVKLQ